jgi:hypothetical protein
LGFYDRPVHLSGPVFENSERGDFVRQIVYGGGCIVRRDREKHAKPWSDLGNGYPFDANSGSGYSLDDDPHTLFLLEGNLAQYKPPARRQAAPALVFGADFCYIN